MSTFLEDLAAQRQKFLDGLNANKGDINLDIFEDFYPDQAHFIYELLQNAEDAGATEVWIDVDASRCRFEHNGSRVFSEADVRSITGIHNSTKTKATDQIGKFGVGFKSVFVYTATPAIWSGPFAFRIRDMVRPESIGSDDSLGERTRFDLPFNSPKRPSDVAFMEVESGLQALAATTLLFLSNITSIKWSSSSGARAELARVQHKGSHVEVRLTDRTGVTEAMHFLRFDELVKGLGKQHVSLAFALEYLQDATAFDASRPLAKQFKIVPAAPGQVSVYFPAKAEVSGLRLHLHGPMVPELSRASIKKTAANEPLFKQLAALAASSLGAIRDLGFLTGDFLAVLPNPQDDLPERYAGIRESIIAAMNNEPLTPVHGRKTHWPARQLLQARATLKALLSDSDVDALVGQQGGPRKWAIAATQKSSNVDRFLEGLAITRWDVDKFVDTLQSRASESARSIPRPPYYETGPEQALMDWLGSKPLEWHQQLYALLEEFLSASGWRKESKAIELGRLRVVRLSGGNYGKGCACYFPTEATPHDEVLPRVDHGVYSSGKSKGQQEAARRFLEAIGVSEVGESQHVEAILKTRYAYEAELPDDKTYWGDLKRFVDLVEGEPATAALFAKAYIFERASDDWARAGEVYLDSPYVETGLTAYYRAIGGDAKRQALAARYQSCAISTTKLAHFAEKLGAQVRLEVIETNVARNPQATYLYSAGGERHTSPINADYVIDRLDELLRQPSLPIAQLVWRTMCLLPPYMLTATFRRSERGGARSADSQLVHTLRDAAWVPQGESFVRPAEALRELLPAGFSFDAGQDWLKKVRFGEEVQRSKEEQRNTIAAAEKLGFRDARALDRALEFVSLPENEQEQFLAESRQTDSSDESDGSSVDSERRRKKVQEGAREAPDRGSELKLRSVSERRDGVKEGADSYLRAFYTKDGVMRCQIGNHALPFKLPGSDLYYFEAVEILTRHETSKHHTQNYLCLCPDHAAMFRFANPDRESMRPVIAAADGERVQLTLAGRMVELIFATRHIGDLKAIMEEDRGPAGPRAEQG